MIYCSLLKMIDGECMRKNNLDRLIVQLHEVDPLNKPLINHILSQIATYANNSQACMTTLKQACDQGGPKVLLLQDVLDKKIHAWIDWYVKTKEMNLCMAMLRRLYPEIGLGESDVKIYHYLDDEKSCKLTQKVIIAINQRRCDDVVAGYLIKVLKYRSSVVFGIYATLVKHVLKDPTTRTAGFFSGHLADLMGPIGEDSSDYWIDFLRHEIETKDENRVDVNNTSNVMKLLHCYQLASQMHWQGVGVEQDQEKSVHLLLQGLKYAKAYVRRCNEDNKDDLSNQIYQCDTVLFQLALQLNGVDLFHKVMLALSKRMSTDLFSSLSLSNNGERYLKIKQLADTEDNIALFILVYYAIQGVGTEPNADEAIQTLGRLQRLLTTEQLHNYGDCLNQLYQLVGEKFEDCEQSLALQRARDLTYQKNYEPAYKAFLPYKDALNANDKQQYISCLIVLARDVSLQGEAKQGDITLPTPEALLEEAADLGSNDALLELAKFNEQKIPANIKQAKLYYSRYAQQTLAILLSGATNEQGLTDLLQFISSYTSSNYMRCDLAMAKAISENEAAIIDVFSRFDSDDATVIHNIYLCCLNRKDTDARYQSLVDQYQIRLMRLLREAPNANLAANEAMTIAQNCDRLCADLELTESSSQWLSLSQDLKQDDHTRQSSVFVSAVDGAATIQQLQTEALTNDIAKIQTVGEWRELYVVCPNKDKRHAFLKLLQHAHTTAGGEAVLSLLHKLGPPKALRGMRSLLKEVLERMRGATVSKEQAYQKLCDELKQRRQGLLNRTESVSTLIRVRARELGGFNLRMDVASLMDPDRGSAPATEVGVEHVDTVQVVAETKSSAMAERMAVAPSSEGVVYVKTTPLTDAENKEGDALVAARLRLLEGGA